MSVVVHIGTQSDKPRKRVAVVGQGQLQSNAVLFSALEFLFPVTFVPEAAKCDAALVFGDSALVDNLLDRDISTFHVNGGPPTHVSRGVVTFSLDRQVPGTFRGETLHDPSLEVFRRVPPANVRCLASLDGNCAWTREERHNTLLYTVGLALPRCDLKELPFTHFQPRRWFAVLPLLDFLRSITADVSYIAPPLRAAFIFDDPNLHSPRYGWIDYRELAEHARRYRYHVAMAMVPLDARLNSTRAVGLFSRNPGQLSLLLHGNNHTRAELSGGDQQGLTALCAQAQRRIQGFERKTGLKVDRVMVPPHGACATTALTAMAGLGFDAVCVSPGSLVHWNDTLGTRYPHIGLGVTELLPDTFPILPRFGFGPDAGMTARLCAFLGQPIICRGHHEDCSGGLNTLAEMANHINGLGEVAWEPLSAILRRNYLRRQEGSGLYIKSFSRKLSISLPEGTTDVFIDWPVKPSVARLLEADNQGAELDVELPYGPCVNPANIAAPQFRASFYLRRALCETRDRVLPAFRKLSTRRVRNGHSSP